MKTELVTTLKRNATDVIAALREHRDPILITEHGRPAAYLVDVTTYEAQQKRMQLLEGIALGERAIQEGRVSSHTEVRKRMGRWLS
ncbi:MAG: type II toxin-antitoxin system Phd/YefM family antitoxin [Kiritimatiellia bacterium]